MVDNVLGSARTGLIFTRIQEGAQPGGLTQPQPGQIEPGIPDHVPSYWVPMGGGAPLNPPPTSFCLFLFHSPPHPGGGRGGCVALFLPAAAKTKTSTII